MAFSASETLTVLLLVPFYRLVNPIELPNMDTFLNWSVILESELYDLASTATQLEFAKDIYNSDDTVKVQSVNGEDILKSSLKKLSHLLASKKLALKKLVDQAEENYESFHKLNKSVLNLQDLSFVDMKALRPGTPMSFSSRFRQPVFYEHSGVHIPLEIFDGYSEILKGLSWSGSLDIVFKENFKNDPNLRWQYFGSYFGFMRVYPAFRWPNHLGLPDLFDIRRRSWYIQSSVTPKDVIILLDRSGSVHGLTLDIMKITARALLNSLGENDYVNVAWFNNKVQWIIPCINTLVQATSQIKGILGDAVEKLTESNLTSYSTALDFAFEEFRKFNEIKKPWVGSNCHKIIMFLSDGGTEWPSELLSRHCNESRNNQIKIFTFACGPHPIPTAVLKEMACSTGGYFSPITTLGSVRFKIRDYIKVLSRSLVYSNNGDLFQWHNFYRDIGGLGLVTTVTLPVFNKNSQGKNSPNLLGVMGIDVSISEMINIFPKHLFGPFGYAFAINTNGFVVFHPRLHDHIIYLEDPPNIYLTDLEGGQAKIKEMEILIINGINGSLKHIKSIVPVGLGHAVVAEVDYFYGAIEATTFRFGIVLPSNHAITNVNISDVNDKLNILLSLEGASIAPWNYCSKNALLDENITIYNLAERIVDNDSSCDQYLINRLLWDAGKAFEIDKRWNETAGSILHNIHSRFLITEGGLTLVRANEEEEINGVSPDPLKNKFYKRASKALNFFFSSRKDKRDRVTVAAGVKLKNGHTAAVIGADIEQESVLKIFKKVFDTGFNEHCTSSEILHCYLLNDGGIIIASNVKQFMPGDFIGVYDPALLEALLAGKVLKREYRQNHESRCSKDSRKIQGKAASSQLSVLKCIYDAIAGFRWNFIYTAFLHIFSRASASKKAENIGGNFEGGYHSCATRSVWYYHDGVTAHSGALKCQLGKRDFRVYFLPRLMLLFLVTQPPCDDSPYFPLFHYLDSHEDNEFYYCNLQEHYRLRPGKCFFREPKVSILDFSTITLNNTYNNYCSWQ